MQARARGTSIGAADLAEHALRLTPSDASDDRHRRTIAAARSHLEAGDMRRARRLANEALERANAGERAEALVLLSDVALAAADEDAALALRREALEAAAEQPRLQSEIHRWLAGQAAMTESIESCVRHALLARHLADELDDDELRAGASAALAHAHFRMGEPDAIQLLEQAVELTAATANPELHRLAVSGLVHAAVWSHQVDRARALLDSRDREWNARNELIKANNLWFRGLLELRAGDLRFAAEHAQQAREIRGQYELDDHENMANVWLIALIAAHRGQLGRARALVDDYRPLSEGTWLDGVRGLVELWEGHPGPAVACFESAESGTRAVRGEEPALTWWRPDHAEALIELGRVDEAVALLDTWEGAALRLGRDALVAQVTRCRGLIYASRGDLAEADAALERAVALLEDAGDPFGRARALLALGIVRRRARQRRAAKEAIQEAATLFEACGAEGWAERARSEIGRIGGRRREEGLTAAERRVAALVAEGRTNREVATALFVGERTVETHLSHIYSKLGVRSRTELARALMSADGAQSSGVSSISS
jgi:DNA-binding CsgD family transcriptional regulator